jgi:type II secretory pathway pseudopilin PulG
VSRFFAFERRFAVDKRVKKIRKGSTLAEICVVLAVVSIVTTVVLSFCMMTNRRSVASANRLHIMEELEMLESIVETWRDSVAVAGKDISLAPDSNSPLIADAGGDQNTIALSDGVLTATMPDGSDIQFKCDAAKTMMFNLIPAEEDPSNVLIVCTVEFNAIGADVVNPPEYVFVVNSRIGESITVIPEGA